MRGHFFIPTFAVMSDYFVHDIQNLTPTTKIKQSHIGKVEIQNELFSWPID